MIPIIAPSRKETRRHLCMMRDARRRELRERLRAASSSVKPVTIATAAGENPAAAVAAAVAGGCLLSQLLSARGLRLLVRMAAGRAAKAAILRRFAEMHDNGVQSS